MRGEFHLCKLSWHGRRSRHVQWIILTRMKWHWNSITMHVGSLCTIVTVLGNFLYSIVRLFDEMRVISSRHFIVIFFNLLLSFQHSWNSLINLAIYKRVNSQKPLSVIHTVMRLVSLVLILVATLSNAQGRVKKRILKCKMIEIPYI